MTITMVVGLGNPGRRYAATRHNLGFRVVERLGERFGPLAWKSEHDALVARGRLGERGFLLVKPQTFMNLSGQAVGPLLRYYKVPLEHLLVVLDDFELPLGRLRLRVSGSHGGHNGLRSIIELLGTQAFKRLRIGIGQPQPGQSPVGHVLGHRPEENAALEEAIAQATDLAAAFVESGRFENWSSS